MLLSVRRRFLFVHIAKTGGTSVRAALQQGRWAEPWYWPMFLCSRFSHLSGHRIATKLPRHAKVVAAKELLPRSEGTGDASVIHTPCTTALLCLASPACCTLGLFLLRPHRPCRPSRSISMCFPQTLTGSTASRLASKSLQHARVCAHC